MSKPSSEPRYPLQSPNQICLNGKAVEAIFGPEPTSLRRLRDYAAKSHEFGDPIDPTFADRRIAPVELRGFGATVLLAASVFHFKIIEIPALKQYLREHGVTL